MSDRGVGAYLIGAVFFLALVVAIAQPWKARGNGGAGDRPVIPAPKPDQPDPPPPGPDKPPSNPTVQGLIEERNRLSQEIEEARRKVRELQAEVARLQGSPQDPGATGQAAPKTGQGRVIDLVAGGEAPHDPEAEQKRRREWEARIRRDNESSVARLEERLDLDDYQAGQLRAILEDELRERSRILDDYSKEGMSLDEFREAVARNRDSAKTRLRALLKDEQWDIYKSLPPTQQVLTSGLVREQ